MIAFLYGSDDQTGFIQDEDTLLRSLIVLDLDCILQQNKPHDSILGFKCIGCHEYHDTNSFWEKCSVFERDKKVIPESSNSRITNFILLDWPEFSKH